VRPGEEVSYSITADFNEQITDITRDPLSVISYIRTNPHSKYRNASGTAATIQSIFQSHCRAMPRVGVVPVMEVREPVTGTQVVDGHATASRTQVCQLGSRADQFTSDVSKTDMDTRSPSQANASQGK
jgi:hypothetical protein